MVDESKRLVYHARSLTFDSPNLSRRDSISVSEDSVKSIETAGSVRSIRPGIRAIISRRLWKSDFGTLCHGIVSHSASLR